MGQFSVREAIVRICGVPDSMEAAPFVVDLPSGSLWVGISSEVRVAARLT